MEEKITAIKPVIAVPNADGPLGIDSRSYNILLLDLAGYKTKEIAAATGFCESEIRTKRGKDVFKRCLALERDRLRKMVLEKQASKIVNNPVDIKLQEMALKAAQVYEKLLGGAKSEFVLKSVADEVLDRTGHKAQFEKTKLTVEVTEKMANRFERALKYNISSADRLLHALDKDEDEPETDARVAKITIKKEVSS